MTEKRRIRAAIIGAGLMGQWHAHEVAALGHRVAVVADPDSRRGKALSGKFPGCLYAESAPAILSPDIANVAHLCSPLETHAELVKSAIGAGLHVLVEKPLAGDLDETRRLLDLAGRAKLLLCPVHQFLFQAGTREALRAVERIGPLLHIDYTACSAGAEGGGSSAEKRVALDILPHPLALLAKFAGVPEKKTGWQVARSGEGDFKCFSEQSGVAVSLTISMRGRPTTNQCRLIGARGTIHLDLFHGFALIEGAGVSRWRKLAHPFTLSSRTLLKAGANLTNRALKGQPAYPGLRELIAHFYRAALRGGSPPITREETLFVAAARDAIAQHLG